jgi:hypothetical protein
MNHSLPLDAYDVPTGIFEILVVLHLTLTLQFQPILELQ